MKFLRNLKHIFAITILSLLMIAGSIYIFRDEFFHSLNGFFVYRTGNGVWQDYVHKHTLTPSNDIAIIKIDERTLNTLQSEGKLQRGNEKMLTIPKSLYAVLVDKLEAAGSRAIAFDIIFQNRDPDEEVFASVLQKYSNIVLASMRPVEGSCETDTDGKYMTCAGAPRSVYASIPWGIIDIDNPYTRPVRASIASAPYRSWKVGSGSTTPGALQLKTLALALIETQSGFVVPPILKEANVLSPYFGVPSIYPSVSLIDVLNAEAGDLIATFSGKYVLIGESGTMIHDAIVSPVTGTMMDGVETHAHFLDAILQNKMLTPIGHDLMLGLIALLTFLTVSLYYYSPKYLSPIIAIVVLVGLLYAARWTYDDLRLVGDIFLTFLAGGVLTYPMTFIYRFFVVDREKRELQSNFGHYIDPHVVQEIADRDEDIQLGGETRVLSVLFSDIAGFTTISEALKTRDLFYLMTSYLSNMTDILIEKGGTLDKYIGDAVMGFFGAPLSYEDHAIRAADTALTMRERLPAFNADLIKHGMQAIDFRVGIATGEVMVGNIGSHDRFNYTVLGDTVNLASRLEGTGKEYDVHIIIPESTKLLLSPRYVVRELDTIAVKGKTEGVRIYELVGYSEHYIDRTLYTNYEKALMFYRKGEYREAGKIWQAQAKDDPPSRVMMYRCVEILKGNITVEDGLYRMTHK